MKAGIRTRLSAMMFIQYFLWGAWYVTLGTWLSKTLHFSAQQVGWAAGATAVGAIISPFFVGIIADRTFATQKVVACLHAVGAILLFVTSRQTTFAMFYASVLAYCICYMPTLALTSALALRQTTDAQREFGSLRVFGTIGWIAAGLLVGTLGLEASEKPMLIAAAVSAFMALYCLTLPDTPPLAKAAKTGLGDVIPKESLIILRQRSMAVFAIASFLICIPLQFYYAFTNLFLNEAGVSNAASRMTGGQMSELLCMLLIPWFFRKLGVKYMLAVGMLAWAIRYVCFAFGDAGPLMWMFWVGIILHGICFDFFFVVGQIYIDKESSAALRAATQGLITFITYGLGMFVGSWLSGLVVGAYTSGHVDAFTHQWRSIWLVSAACSAVPLILFLVLFTDKPRTVVGDSVRT
jgi:nucleoside transporter